MRDLGLILETGFLDSQLGESTCEVRQGRGGSNVACSVGEMRAEAAQQVENELGVWDRVADLTQGIGKLLDARTILQDS